MADTAKISTKTEQKIKVSGWGYRHQQSLVLFLTFSVAFSMRSSMGVSLVAMTDVKEIDANSTTNETRNFGILQALVLAPPYPTFDWSKKVQDAVLSSFFWGYMLLQIPAGQLAHRFGSRYLLMGSMLINCVVSFLFPTAAYQGGWICACICRVLLGLSQACIVPGLHTSLGKWAPLHERGRLSAFVYGGQAIGAVIGLPTAGFISASSLGWPGIFWFYGFLSGSVVILLWWLVADTPAQHKKISQEEREYIESDLGTKKRIPVPWSKILRHKGLYAIIIGHIGQTWGQTTIYNEIPAYLNKILKVEIKANGVLTALPFLVMWFTNFFFSWLSDMLIVKSVFSVTVTRKLANTVGSIPSAIGLIALAYVPPSVLTVEMLLITICALKVSSNLGCYINHIDISPNFAGTMMSLSNFSSNLGAAIAPLILSYILTDVTDPACWRQVFLLTAGMYVVTNTVYVLIGTAVRADWNEPEKETKEDDKESQPMIDKIKQ